MIKKTYTYTDYNGQERTEEHYFNLNRSEVVKMQVSVEGGYAGMLEKAVKNNDGKVIMEVIDTLIEKSYGIKSLDGKRFEKSEEITRAFKQTEAYDQLFMDLVTNAEAAAEFVNGILPKMPQN